MTEPLVGIIMGSRSDWETMRHAADLLDQLGLPHETKVVSAHRTPKRLYDYAHSAKDRGLKLVIAGAGGAAHLAGMTASIFFFQAEDGIRDLIVTGVQTCALPI